MTNDAPDSFSQIAEILSRSLEKAFDEVCPKRYGAPLSLRRLPAPDDEQTVAFCLKGPDDTTLRIDVAITHVGGNVYDITTQVDGGDARRFTYSEPATSGSSLSIAPYLGKKIAKHVLNEVERRLGKLILRNEVTAEAA